MIPSENGIEILVKEPYLGLMGGKGLINCSENKASYSNSLTVTG